MALTQNGVLKRDDNDSPVMGGTSSVDNATIVNASFDPVTRRLLTDTAGGSGTVTSVSVVTANGFAGSVANPTTTPAITLSTTITGLIKGNGTQLLLAVGNTDYQLPIILTTTGTSGVATFNGTTLNIPNYANSGGTLTSVASADATITVTNPNTTVDLAVVKSPKLTTARTIGTLTGDGTTAGSSFDGTANNTNALVLATVNSNVGSFTNASITVNAKGLITAASSGAAGGLVVGTTAITSGTTTRVLYDNAGTLGEYVVSGSGNVAMTTSPAFTTPDLGTPSALVATNATGTASALTSGITLALKSATTTVDVSAATAPSANQVLKATDSTHATWQTLTTGAALDYQAFTASGTWTKPGGLTGNEMVVIQMWAGGGGGGTGGGGGGGAYNTFTVVASALSGTETVTVGAAGAGNVGAGGVGGNSSFKTYTVYGGGGGGSSSNDGAGGGGGLLSASTTPAAQDGTAGGNPLGGTGATSAANATASNFGGGGGGSSNSHPVGGASVYGGGGGGANFTGGIGGNSVYGGGGGGTKNGSAAGGTSIFGGAGGAGSAGGTGTAGTVPSGGGGGGGTQGGAGARGEVRVWVI